MKTKTVYYDALRGPIAVKPIQFIESITNGNGFNTGDCVICKVTARNTHSGFKTGEIIRVEPYSIVRLLSGNRCYSIGTGEIKRIIEQNKKGI